MGIKLRLIHVVGTRYEIGFYNDAQHKVTQRITVSKEEHAMSFEELRRKFNAPPGVSLFGREARIWNTEDGENNHPGDAYWADWMHEEDGHCMYWDNCRDPRGHLVVVLPNGIPFDTMSRGTNCTKPQDRLHRCWVFEGEAPMLNINGPRSENGAGSILAGNWHGYIRNGELVT